MPRPFNDAVITTAGAELLLQVETEAAYLEITRVAVGSGSYSSAEKAVSNLRSRTALKTQKNSYTPSSVAAVDSSSIKITALISNWDPVEEEPLVTTGYYINEVGVFAKASNSDTEILYCIAVTSGSSGDYMPAYSAGGAAQITQDIYLSVGSAATTYVNVAGAAYLASSGLALESRVTDLETVSKTDGVIGTDVSSASCQFCRLYKQGNRVRAYVGIGYYDGTTALGINTTYFTIPSGYRPDANISFPAIANRSGGGSAVVPLKFGTDGTIQQSTFSDITAIQATAEWSIG